MALNIKAVIVSIILVIIAFIIIFQFVGTSADDLTGAADTITDANNCSEDTQTDTAGERLIYNSSDKCCSNSTGGCIYTAGQYDLPLNSLFSSSGIALLILMASILIFVIILSLKSVKKSQ